uniref:Uncharacterized protein n=1 Tax=Chlamydomonas leiostraca TaxID=1034604 RepID=A0A7S0WRF3_9CHLO
MHGRMMRHQGRLVVEGAARHDRLVLHPLDWQGTHSALGGGPEPLSQDQAVHAPAAGVHCIARRAARSSLSLSLCVFMSGDPEQGASAAWLLGCLAAACVRGSGSQQRRQHSGLLVPARRTLFSFDWVLHAHTADK